MRINSIIMPELRRGLRALKLGLKWLPGLLVFVVVGLEDAAWLDHTSRSLRFVIQIFIVWRVIGMTPCDGCVWAGDMRLCVVGRWISWVV